MSTTLHRWKIRPTNKQGKFGSVGAEESSRLKTSNYVGAKGDVPKIYGFVRLCAPSAFVLSNTFPNKSNLCHASHSFYVLKRLFPFNSYWHCA